ncbi:hypothetical protein HPO96_37170 [Kribbella sandramycini]|uniref:Uncharacterized protein n=1 Tax=Kribbella sandramycini TaxID=60450 RepID=A0A7Y4L7P5_9ACTN|nr:hypothetical protein [Kribbella sandramycini]MBB6564434.1 hypothetical protein [Kribbella sandramycini]NOL45892.1 hypothetical protein [Kribbella sandramycini]
MTPEQHRAKAEDLLGSTHGYAPSHPVRVDKLARATVHALLALGPTTRTPTLRKPAASKETSK